MKNKIDLRNDFLDSLRNELSKIEGTYNFDIAAATGILIEKLYKELDFWEKQTFIDTATVDEYVDKHAVLFGLKRRYATKATGLVKITGKPYTVINENTIVLNRNSVKYKTLHEKFLDANGEAVIEVECLTAGANGNASVGEISIFEIQNSNIYTVTNEMAISNGYNKEPNEVLVERCKEKATRPAHSGNVYDYEQWAKEVEGVGKVLVKPLWNGNGTVKVLIANYNNLVADALLLGKVRERIESADGRPIGASVTVESFRNKYVDLDVQVILKNNFSLADVSEKIKSMLTALIKSNQAAFTKDNRTYLSVNRLEKHILELEEINDAFVLANNSKNNLLIDNEEILLARDVTVHE